NGNDVTGLQVEGKTFEMNQQHITEWRLVSPDYFRTLGIRLVRGRFPNRSDQEQTTPIVVINESLARAQWANEEPLGRRIRLLNGPPERATTAFLTVVGVIADVKNGGLTKPPGLEVYVPLRQRVAAVANMGVVQQRSLAVRTSVDPLTLANAIRQEVWA